LDKSQSTAHLHSSLAVLYQLFWISSRFFGTSKQLCFRH